MTPRPGWTARRATIGVLTVLYVVMWAGGVIGYVFRGGPGPGEEWTAPAFLLLAAALVLVTATPRAAAWLSAVLAAGFVVEYVGLRCQCIFGAYTYTAALQPLVLGVPVAIACAWMILVAYVRQMLGPRRWPWGVEALVGAAWLTAIDMVVDPVAAGPLGYWTWRNPGFYEGIPSENFAGWFAVGVVIFAVLRLGAPVPSLHAAARRVGVSIVLFFGIIAAVHGVVGAACVSGALLALHWGGGRAGKLGEKPDHRASINAATTIAIKTAMDPHVTLATLFILRPPPGSFATRWPGRVGRGVRRNACDFR